MLCNLCARNCNVNREIDKGYCLAPNYMVIARYSRHMWEEPIISGDNGSGTIFFSYCNLRCCFCQNYEVSLEHRGRKVSVDEFCDICLELQKSGVNNINLVSPTPYVKYIIEGINKARERELTLPIVYNTGTYENVDTIKMLDGIVDIYLPDLKYYSDELSLKYSKCSNYFKVASHAIEEMYKQVGAPIIESGIMKRGVIVRHLVLPGHIDDSKKIIKYLYFKYHDNIFISIMSQYTPIRESIYDNLNRSVYEEEYDSVVNYAYDLGVRNAFIQDGKSIGESFIPDFDKFRDI